MGWPWAAVRRPRGSWYKGLVSQVGQIGRKWRFEEITMAVKGSVELLRCGRSSGEYFCRGINENGHCDVGNFHTLAV